MKSTRHSCKDRQLQIELLRTRAALERESLAYSFRQFTGQFRVGRIFGQLVGKSRAGLVVNGLSFLTRYPYLLSLLTGAFAGPKVKWLGALGLIAASWFTSRPEEVAADDELHPR